MRPKLLAIFSAISAAALLFAYCGDSSSDGDIAFAVFTDTTTSGTVTIGGSDISFTTAAVTPFKTDIGITIDGSLMEASIDNAAMSISTNGRNTVLTEEQKTALLSASQELYSRFTENGMTMQNHEYMAVKMTAYWSKAPNDYAYGERNIVSREYAGTFGNSYNAGISRNEGVRCIRKNSWVTVKYDDYWGSHSYRIRVNSRGTTKYGFGHSGYDCMGRCGGDCGWGAPSAWCKDCLDHDECSVKNRSSGGSNDRHCGDEFNEAMDDWLWGVLRGCSG